MPTRTKRLPPRKSGARQLAVYLGDLVLVSDKSFKWTEHKAVRRLWITQMWSFWLLLLMTGLHIVLELTLQPPPLIDTAWLVFTTVATSWLLLLEALIAMAFYRHLLLTGKVLRLAPIVFFWLAWVLMFAQLYFRLYTIWPGFYSHSQLSFGTLGWFTLIDLPFLVYSAAVTFTVSTPGLSSASFLVTSLNVVEVIGNVTLIALFVSTFVNKSTAKKMKAPGSRK